MGPMKSRIFFLTAVLLSLYFIVPTAQADTVHLKNGKALKVEKSWQEDDQVCFIFHGMKASLPQSKVVRIEKGAGNPANPARPENRSTAEIKATRPQPAAQTLPPQIIKTAANSAAPQQLPQPTKKPLALCKDGLANMKWGATRATVRGLEKKQIDSGLKDVTEFVRPNDLLKLGGATLTTVVYAFWRDQLYTVSIWTRGREDFMALRDTVFMLFGNGTRIDGSGEKYLWSNSSADVMLRYSRDDQYGLLWMRGKELDRKLKLSQLNGHTSYLKRMKSIR